MKAMKNAIQKVLEKGREEMCMKKLLQFVCAMMMAFGMNMSMMSSAFAKTVQIQNVTLNVKASKTLTLHKKGKVKSWKITKGARVIKLTRLGNKKVRITAKKAGSATLRAKTAKNSYLYKIKVRKAASSKPTSTPASNDQAALIFSNPAASVQGDPGQFTVNPANIYRKGNQLIVECVFLNMTFGSLNGVNSLHVEMWDNSDNQLIAQGDFGNIAFTHPVGEMGTYLYTLTFTPTAKGAATYDFPNGITTLTNCQLA